MLLGDLGPRRLALEEWLGNETSQGFAVSSGGPVTSPPTAAFHCPREAREEKGGGE